MYALSFALQVNFSASNYFVSLISICLSEKDIYLFTANYFLYAVYFLTNYWSTWQYVYIYKVVYRQQCWIKHYFWSQLQLVHQVDPSSPLIPSDFSPIVTAGVSQHVSHRDGRWIPWQPWVHCHPDVCETVSWHGYTPRRGHCILDQGSRKVLSMLVSRVLYDRQVYGNEAILLCRLFVVVIVTGKLLLCVWLFRLGEWWFRWKGKWDIYHGWRKYLQKVIKVIDGCVFILISIQHKICNYKHQYTSTNDGVYKDGTIQFTKPVCFNYNVPFLAWPITLSAIRLNSFFHQEKRIIPETYHPSW